MIASLESDKISIIVPVHNGSKYLDKLYKNIAKQTYNNIEILFVENYSEDNSLEVLEKIAAKDNRVVVLESKQRGTTLADKKGIEIASGKYIVFMDQDDKYKNKNALRYMYNTIKETGSDICQFSYYTYYGYGIKKKKVFTSDKRIFLTAEDIRQGEIGSIFQGFSGGHLSSDVWDKIYSAKVLKETKNRILISACYAEDYYLNSLFFLSDRVKKVCIDCKGYYVWDNRYGLSSKDSGKILMEDYNLIKPVIHNRLKEVGAGQESFYKLHLESLYFMLAFLKDNIKKLDIAESYNLIEWVNSLEFIRLAKDYINNELEEEKKWEGLNYLSSDFTAKDFYSRYK